MIPLHRSTKYLSTFPTMISSRFPSFQQSILIENYEFENYENFIWTIGISDDSILIDMKILSLEWSWCLKMGRFYSHWSIFRKLWKFYSNDRENVNWNDSILIDLWSIFRKFYSNDFDKRTGTILFSLIWKFYYSIVKSELGRFYSHWSTIKVWKFYSNDCDENWTTGTILSMHPCWIEKFNFEFNSIWIYIIDDD